MPTCPPCIPSPGGRPHDLTASRVEGQSRGRPSTRPPCTTGLARRSCRTCTSDPPSSSASQSSVHRPGSRRRGPSACSSTPRADASRASSYAPAQPAHGSYWMHSQWPVRVLARELVSRPRGRTRSSRHQRSASDSRARRRMRRPRRRQRRASTGGAASIGCVNRTRVHRRRRPAAIVSYRLRCVRARGEARSRVRRASAAAVRRVAVRREQERHVIVLRRRRRR